jgi:hypothetical protein
MIIVLIFITLATFALTYFSKRKYGLPALALVAGSVLSASWSSYVTISLQQGGFVLVSPPLNVVVAVSLILLPALILLTVGPSHSKTHHRLFSATLFTVLAMSLIITAIDREAPNLASSVPYIKEVTALQPLFVVAGVFVAIVDSFIHHMPGKAKS